MTLTLEEITSLLREHKLHTADCPVLNAERSRAMGYGVCMPDCECYVENL